MHMIRFNFKIIADRLGKSIADIARETGVNRNTARALYHGTIDGIKFNTLEKICSAYRLSIGDLLVFDSPKTRADQGRPTRLYKQEGEIVPITLWWPFVVANNLPNRYFDCSYSEISTYCKKENGEVYLDADRMERLAKSVYRRYGVRAEFDLLWNEYLKTADGLQEVYRSTRRLELSRATVADMISALEEIARAYHDFWKMSIFIDSFDAGFDSETIQEIARQYRISPRDASILATPAEHTFNVEKQIALLHLAKTYLRRKTISLAELSRDKAVIEYQAAFDWADTNYAFAKHISFSDVAFDIKKLRAQPEKLRADLKRLQSAPTAHRRKITQLLKAYGLKKNPLWFFARLTYWREHRKKHNLMGIQAIYLLLDEVERRTGIAGKYLKFVLPDELERVLRGVLTKETLHRRYEKGVMAVIANENEYRIFEGSEAASLRDELEARLCASDSASADVLRGTVASQGYARGSARVVLGQEDFSHFREGEILVTGMTRPDFLPLMKRAAGIVTNEGGLTSHAAIASRELGKPCVIGTKRATTAIRSGDIVEVRAHHGTVRILERNHSR